MKRWLFSVVLLFLASTASLQAQRTIHYFGVYCNAYPGEAGGINAGVASDQVIVSHIFNEYVSPAAWEVEVRKVEVMGEEATKAGAPMMPPESMPAICLIPPPLPGAKSR